MVDRGYHADAGIMTEPTANRIAPLSYLYPSLGLPAIAASILEAIVSTARLIGSASKWA